MTLTKSDLDALLEMHRKATGEWSVDESKQACLFAGVERDGYHVQGPDYIPDYKCPMLSKHSAELIATLHNAFSQLHALALKGLESEEKK